MIISNNLEESIVFEDYNKKQEQLEHKQKLTHVSSFTKDAYEILDKGEVNYGDTFPWIKTHPNFRMRPSEVTIWAGASSSGKSMVMGQVALHLSRTEKVGIASFEMPPVQTVKRMMIQAISKSPTLEYVEKFDKELNLWIYNHVGTLSQETVYGMCRYMAKEKGIKHIMIDSLVKCGVNQSDNEPQKQFMSKIQDIAKEYNIHIHVVMHLKKTEKETDIPDKYSVKGAGELVDLCDNLLLVWRNKIKESLSEKNSKDLSESQLKQLEMPDCFIRVAKQRHWSYEKTIGFWFNTDRQQWCEDERKQPQNYV